MSIGRNIAFDYAKGIGILLVVYGHVAHGLLSARLPMDREWYELIESVIYSFHMPLFFFLSGALFPGSLARRGGRKLIENKFEVVFYPYIIWSLIQGLIEVALADFTNGTATLGQVLSLLWLPRAQFWFLYTLFFIYLASAALYRRSDSYWSTAILALAVILFFSGFPSINYHTINLFGRNFVFFALGVSASGLLFRGDATQYRTLLLFLFAALLFVGSQYLFHGLLGLRGIGSGQFLLLLAFSGIAFVMASCHVLARFEIRWLAFLGRHSMEIYLIHTICSGGIRIVLQKLFGITDVSLHLALGVLFGVGAPLLVAVLAPKLGLKWLFVPPRKLFFWAAR